MAAARPVCFTATPLTAASSSRSPAIPRAQRSLTAAATRLDTGSPASGAAFASASSAALAAAAVVGRLYQRRQRRRNSREASLVVRFGQHTCGGVGMRRKFYRPETGIAMAPQGPVSAPYREMQFVDDISELAKQYDAFTLDQYGVLHDGEQAYPGVAECLKHLHDAGKRSVILSNYSGRSTEQRNRLKKIGINPDHVEGVITSGELCHRYLVRNVGKKLGRRILWISWHDLEERGLRDYFDGLDGYELVEDVMDADFILVSGVESIYAGTESAKRTKFEKDGNVKKFTKLFMQALNNRTCPMLCANPDVRVMRPGGWKAYLPGALAQHYKDLGGHVQYFGKPYNAAFEAARDMLEDLELVPTSASASTTAAASGTGTITTVLEDTAVEEPELRICHIGDSLAHDVQGAANAGIDSALVVRTGIHADALENLDEQSVKALCQKVKSPLPQAVMPKFTWSNGHE